MTEKIENMLMPGGAGGGHSRSGTGQRASETTKPTTTRRRFSKEKQYRI